MICLPNLLLFPYKRLPVNPLPRRLVQRIRQCAEDGREGWLAHARWGGFVFYKMHVNRLGRLAHSNHHSSRYLACRLEQYFMQIG